MMVKVKKMNNLEIVKVSIKNLKSNKIRSFLTMLGIIIGISSVITMSSIGKGGQQSITGNLKNGGYGKFTVSVNKNDENFRWKYLITEEILEKLKEKRLFKNISPDISLKMITKIKGRKEFLFTEVSTFEYEEIQPLDIISGRNFIPLDYISGEKNAVIDNVTATQLFGKPENSIGKTLEVIKDIKGISKTFIVIGVMKNPVEELIKVMGGKRVPRYMRIPLKTYEKNYKAIGEGYSGLLVESENPNNIAKDMKLMTEYLENITGIKDLYEVNIKNTGTESFDKILTTLNIFITFVAGISLFVGGIGVMNIMLVSVIERTKEIGIRKAIGATDKDILIQFLIESIILTGLGGISGIIIGVLLGYSLGYIIGIPPIFTLTSILVSLIVSTAIGIIFGVAPAKKAAQLNPIDALRSEG